MYKNSNRKLIIASLISLLVVPFSLSLGQGKWNIIKEDTVRFNDLFTEEPRSSTPVAYVDTNDAAHQYYTIEGALKAAKDDGGSNTIYVIPSETEGKCNTVSIIHDCEIAVGDTLILPYSGTEYLDETGTHGSGFADNNTNNRKIQISLNQNVKLTVNGGFIIGGVNGSGENPMGQASGAYCELVMHKGSSIIVNGGNEGNNGKLMCFGFIKEATADANTKITFNSGSSLITPIAFYDYSSGTKMTYMVANEVFPFKQYDVPSIRSEMVFKHGSILTGKLHLYGGNVKDINVQANLVATEGAFLNLTSSKSQISWKFKDRDLETTTSTMASHQSIIEISGTCQLGGIKVSLKLGEIFGKPVEKDIDSKNYYLPIPCGFDVSVQSGGIFTVPSSLKGAKFMPGSSLTVENGGAVAMDSGVLFYQSKTSSDGSSSLDDYDDGNKYPSSSPATFENYGVVYINSGFEGVIQTNSSTALLYLSNNYSSISDSKEGNSDATYSWGGAKGLINKNEAISSFEKQSKYNSSSDHWLPITKYTIKINAVSYSGALHYFPKFNSFFTYSLKSNDFEHKLDDLCQTTSSNALWNPSTISLNGAVFEGDYMKIVPVNDECREISANFSFENWVKITQNIEITVTAKK